MGWGGGGGEEGAWWGGVVRVGGFEVGRVSVELG